MQPRQLGPYRLIEPLGAGGMGEVFLAEDTRLGRKVAIKLLPQEFAADPERIARFSQEARAAAALNHPHIAAVYDVGADAGTHYMVQEFLQGRPLRDSLATGPLQRTRALTLAAEIAEGLAAAHAAGIVHRDLKPENVFVSPEGHAKILDFGLAKLTEVSVASPSGPGGSTRSPTMMHTMAGALMGTAGYMAPEQVAGHEVDRRADLFALGCVLYEMLVGERAFEGETLIDTLHAISRQEPAELRAGSSLDGDVRWLLLKCMAKERGARYQHADDLAIDLRRLAGAAGPVAAGGETPGTVAPASSSRLPWATAAAALLVAAVAIFWPRASTAPEVFRLAIPAAFLTGDARYQAISPDGRLVAYLTRETSPVSLVLQSLDSFEVRPVRGSNDAFSPFFSPDGRTLAFFASGRLWSVDVAGGEPRPVCDVATTNSSGVWIDDTIYFTSWATGTGVYRVPARGGVAEQAYAAFGRDRDYTRVRSLPGGIGVSIEAIQWAGRTGTTDLVFFDGRPPVEIQRPQATYLEDGHALYVEGGQLFRARYDATDYSITGAPVPLVDSVVDYVVSPSGTLAYRSGSGDSLRSMVRMTRDGGATTVVAASDLFTRPQLSPDGSRIAAGMGGALTIVDAVRGVRRPLIDGALYPQWAPDGESLVYLQPTEGAYEFRRMRIEATNAPETLHVQEISMWPTDISPDGSQLLYYEIHPQTERDIWVLPLDGSDTPLPYLVTPASERSAVFSPDGRWVAYMSDVTGSEEVYVRPAPGMQGDEVLVTTAGGREPRWAPDGSEIFFRRSDELWAVPVAMQPRFTVGTAELLFRGNFYSEDGARNQEYDVFPNGDFLMNVLPDSNDQLRIVVNWFEELKRLPEGQ